MAIRPAQLQMWVSLATEVWILSQLTEIRFLALNLVLDTRAMGEISPMNFDGN